MTSSLSQTSLINLEHSRILIYNGAGAVGVDELKKSCEELPHKPLVKVIDAEDLRTKDWENGTSCLVFGGGETSQMESALGEEGLKRIFNAVFNKGIAFVGFCAGAYLASEERAFVGSGNGVVKGKLPFFPGLAWGPVFSCADKEPMAVTVKIEKSEGKVHYFNGPTFKLTQEHEKKGILALGHYVGHGYPEVCALSFKSGKGTVRLCGPHPEYSRWQNFKNERFEKLAAELQFHAEHQQKLFQLLFSDIP